MEVLTKPLRRLSPRAIAITGLVTVVAVLALLVFGLAPLTYTLLLPAGEAAASIASLIVSIGGTILTVLHLPKVFIEAYQMRLFDDALYEVVDAIRRMTEEPSDG